MDVALHIGQSKVDRCPGSFGMIFKTKAHALPFGSSRCSRKRFMLPVITRVKTQSFESFAM